MNETIERNYFTTLNSVDVSDTVEKKNGMSYLSWAWAWGELKKRHPTATYTIYENRDGWNYHTDGKTCWVKTGVTVDGMEHIEFLPVMDVRNRSIPLANVTSFDVNKAIQRSLTKAVARQGLGLYVFAGEDLPEELITGEEAKPEKPEPKKPAEPAPKKPEPKKPIILCEVCGNPITDYGKVPAETIIAGSKKTYGRCMCYSCAVKAKEGNT